MLTPHTVRDVMSADTVAVRPHVAFKDIVLLFARHHVTAVPVVDDDRRVIGVVSETDLLGVPRPSIRSGSRHHAPRTRAHELMTSPVVTVGPEDAARVAARLLRRYGIAQLPVVDRQGLLMGMVSRSDLLGMFARSDHDIAADVRSQVLADVLPANGRGVSADVTDGVVVLNGRVTRRSLVPTIMSLSRQVDGVVDVIEHVAYDVDDTGLGPSSPAAMEILHRLLPRPR